MKKFFALLLALAMVLSLAACGGSDESGETGSADAQTAGSGETTIEDTEAETTPAEGTEAAQAEEYVTITASVVISGQFKVARSGLQVTDADGNGRYNIDDAMFCAHREFCPEGDAGYERVEGGDGLYITKLWGLENDGAFGYYLNDAMALSLSDEIKDGDYLVVFAYMDTTEYSDIYTWASVEAGEDGKVTFTLNGYVGYDDSWNPVAGPIMGAAVRLDGEYVDGVTDENGQITLDLPKDDAILYQIEFYGEDLGIVPTIIYY